jgi:hypothetical protein
MKGLALGIAIGIVLAGGTVALASIPDSAGVIHGCRNNKDGSLRIIDTDAGQTCKSSETALPWNQTGPQGPAGPAGPPGLSNVHVVTVLYPDYSGQINCPTGETALSIAFSFPNVPVAVWYRPTRDGQPVADGQAPNGYTYTTAQNYQPTGYLTCATTN